MWVKIYKDKKKKIKDYSIKVFFDHLSFTVALEFFLHYSWKTFKFSFKILKWLFILSIVLWFIGWLCISCSECIRWFLHKVFDVYFYNIWNTLGLAKVKYFFCVTHKELILDLGTQASILCAEDYMGWSIDRKNL